MIQQTFFLVNTVQLTGNVIGASQGAPLWHSRVPAGDVTCELYCSTHVYFVFTDSELITQCYEQRTT